MNWNKLTDEEVMTIATPIMDILMQAAEDIDYARHIRDFSKDAKRGLGQEDFVAQCKGYQKAWGHFTDRELIGIIKKADHVRIL